VMFLVLFSSWVLSPKSTFLKNYWSLPFGSGLWGPMNAGHFLLNPITAPALFCFVVWLVYSTNKLLYLPPPKRRPLLTSHKLVIQLLLSTGLILGLTALFEPTISGPISKLFVSPKLTGSSGNGNEALRWSEYYGFKISTDDIKSHPRYLDAFMCRASWRVENGDYENALSDFMKVYDIYYRGDFKYYRRFRPLEYNVQVAWLLSTCPNDKIRDGVQAIKLAKKAITVYGVDLIGIPIDQPPLEQKKYHDWRNDPVKSAQLLQVLAAAYAEAGEFEDACNMQKKAYDLLVAHHPTWFKEEKALLTEQLEGYKANKSWRQILKSIRYIYVKCF